MASPPVSNYYDLNRRAMLEMLDDYTHCGDPSLSSMKRKRNRRYEKPDLVLFGTLQETDFSRPFISTKFS